MATFGESIGTLAFFYPKIDSVSAKAFSEITEDWMVGRLLPYAELYNRITDTWQDEHKPVWKGPSKVKDNPLTVALLTNSKIFVWLDEGDDGKPVKRKVKVEPAVGATRRGTFKRVGASKRVRRRKDGRKEFFPRREEKTIEPRFWSRELIRREQKKLAGTSRPYTSKSKVNPGIIYSFEQIAFAPTVKKKFSRGNGYRLKKMRFKL